MGIFNRFTDTIFLKKETDLEKRYYALSTLIKQYPNNEDLKKEFHIAEAGYNGEKEIVYQLEKANIGMFVLRDLNYAYEDLTAQIDFIVITPYNRYLIECKNIKGDITVNEKGDFIKTYNYEGKTIKEGMESPLRQVEAQREVIRKIGESQDTKLDIFLEKIFKVDLSPCRKTLVVLTNKKSVLDTSKAPEDIKNRVIKSDNLVRQIEQDIKQDNKDEMSLSKERMEKIANAYLNFNINKQTDWYAYYKEKYKLKETNIFDKDIKTRLVNLRKKIAKEQNIPAYYVFTNEELEKLIETHPKTIGDLKNILPEVKIKCHGEKIIQEMNKYLTDIEIL